MMFPQYQQQPQRMPQVRSVVDVLQMMTGMEPMYHGGAPQPQGAPQWGGGQAPGQPAFGGQQLGQVATALSQMIASQWAQRG